ncbi:Uncharacterized conserved protein YdiU, UPF0061 family [Nonlabens sp. Hel1_33_55]|uniref:protein adenylyltransferase SelO n=1 Tax=Nonlabens sp. Hel1_33_55 TaxID=1336802 RepID=UPI000875E6CD|nr:YdiU family protein [Nonlabens sp. Hel1_33_55]SCX98078.1 Uncharacterized conserved protein YdiU, UPF0061 family [Nonlabens sp. Hel1_33_55]
MIDLKASTFEEKLSADASKSSEPRQVLKSHYSLIDTQPFESPQVIHVSNVMASVLGFSNADLNSVKFKDLVTGKADYLDKSFAMNYGGHQFGNWAGQLGDGRAINIGQIENGDVQWQLQLKGAGPTPYSRRGDGYAVLRSSIREHLCSEAMHHLGVPTTRSLSLSLSGNEVYRDMFYDGNPAYEKGAIVCRVAPSFIRFGNFQIFAANNEKDELQQLVDYTIEHHFAHIKSSGTEKYLEFFQEVTTTTLTMIMHWQRVGFVHGVMNTDNMSILGLTIDYGPYGWLDDYNPGWTPNTTDNQHKRYRYGAQPEIGLWNLWQLANALFLLINDSTALGDILDSYKREYPIRHQEMMKSKLGLQKKDFNDAILIKDLLDLLPIYETDMTIFYRQLIAVNQDSTFNEAWEVLKISFYDVEQMPASVKNQWVKWIENYIERLEKESAFEKARTLQMQQSNPKYVLRNYISQLVIEKAEEVNYDLLNEVYEMLKKPYEDQPEMKHWYAKRPDWARNKPGSSQLSCSS